MVRICLISVTTVLLGLGCARENPAFDELDELGDGTADTTGDGDGDPTSAEEGTADGSGDGDGDDPTTGDGDGDDPTTGDGDGDDPTTGDGDGDGDGDGLVCAEGLDDCFGECIDTKFDPSHCGGCGQGCAADEPICAVGSCVAKRYVFVTPGVNGSLTGGLIGGDVLCNDWAEAAQLPGNYKAWLSGLQLGSPALSFSKDGAFVLKNGPIVAYSWADLTDGQLLAPINRDAFGQPIPPTPSETCGLEAAVWTGTSSAGTPQGPDCGGWLLSLGNGQVGSPFATDANWTALDCEADCNELLGLYCVQQ